MAAVTSLAFAVNAANACDARVFATSTTPACDVVHEKPELSWILDPSLDLLPLLVHIKEDLAWISQSYARIVFHHGQATQNQSKRWFKRGDEQAKLWADQSREAAVSKDSFGSIIPHRERGVKGKLVHFPLNPLQSTWGMGVSKNAQMQHSGGTGRRRFRVGPVQQCCREARASKLERGWRWCTWVIAL
jgi:hypothetical protein